MIAGFGVGNSLVDFRSVVLPAFSKLGEKVAEMNLRGRPQRELVWICL